MALTTSHLTGYTSSVRKSNPFYHINKCPYSFTTFGLSENPLLKYRLFSHYKNVSVLEVDVNVLSKSNIYKTSRIKWTSRTS